MSWRCNKSSGFYLFTTRIWLYCCTGFFFFSPLDEEEEVLIWSTWPVRVYMCVCVAALYQQIWWGGGESEVVRRSTARMYDTSGVCVYTCEHYSTTYQWLFLVTMMHNLGRSFREGVGETSALAKPWTLISSLCNFFCIMPVCVCVCACSPLWYRILFQKYSMRGFSCVFKFSREYLTTSSIRSELKPLSISQTWQWCVPVLNCSLPNNSKV